MQSAQRYEAMVRAQEHDQARILADAPALANDRWSPDATRFREDPFRKSDTLDRLISFIEPSDVVVDVGGGAGRYLPLALHCKEYVNVDPSSSMGEQFEAAVHDAGVTNARWVKSDWLAAEEQGDVCFSANVVYYVSNIVPFVEKLESAARRRVMIVMHSVSPLNIGAHIYRLVYERERPPDPGFQDLLPVLWDMGILPEVVVLGPSDFIAERPRYSARQDAVSSEIPHTLPPERVEPARLALEQHFDEIFVRDEDGTFRRRPHPSRVLLVTWISRHAS